MKKEVVICDICEHEFSPYSNEWGKLKIRNENYCNFDNFERCKWEKLDLCQDCVEELIKFVKKKGKK